MSDFLKRLLAGSISASNGAIAVAGDNNAPITLEQNLTANLSDQDLRKLAGYLAEEMVSAQNAKAAIGTPLIPSDLTTRVNGEKQLDAQIDSIRDLIDQKPGIALDLLEKLYAAVGCAASGRIRFRIKANIGICHHLLGDDLTGSRYLREAYADAPEEPKAIANNVLGLTLGRDPRAAFKFALEQIGLHPDNEALAGYLVQSAAYLEDITAPLDLVPIDLRSHPDVLLGYIHFLQKRASDASWWRAARDASDAHPDNDALRYYAAEATLAEIAQDSTIRKTNAISAGQNEQLRAAVRVLEARWQKALTSEAEHFRPDQGSIGHNLATAYFLLRDFDAIRQFSSAALADKRCPPMVFEHIGRLALLIGDTETAKTVLARGIDSPDLAFIRFNLAATEHDWQAVAATTEETISRFPETERCWCRVLTRIAAMEVRGTGFPQDELRALGPVASASARAHVIIARTARRHSHEYLSVTEYDIACSLITPDGDYADRLMVAEEGARRRDWDRVITLLSGYVPLVNENDELETLALAFANIMPPREQGLQFFDALPAAIRNKPSFALLAGTMHYNRGGLEQAEVDFLRAHAADPRSLDAILSLTKTYLRGNKPDLAASLLATIDADEVDGNSISKMHLAQLMAAHGRTQDGIRLGYNVLCSEPNSAKVCLAYVGLFLAVDSKLFVDTDTVRPGCWVHLENEHGEHFAVIVDDGSPDYRQHMVPQDHPLVVGVLDKKVGDSFEFKRDVGPSVRWTVREVVDKYVHVFRDTMESYEHRFPNHPGLYKLKVPKDDLSALLETVKDQSQRQRKGLDFYLEHHLPLSVAAPAMRLDVITLATRIRDTSSPIIANTGQLTDLELAIHKLAADKFDLVVLDTYTAWSVACGELFPLLKRIFPDLAVPRSVIDELQEVLAQFDKNFEQESMALSWKDGQFYRDVSTPEQLLAQADAIRARIDAISSHCEVLPVHWKEAPPEAAKQIIEAVRETHIWDAAYLASSERALLLSEDMFYRQWASAIFPVMQHIWLQAIFKYAWDAEAISRAEYARAILVLASSRHDYVSVDPRTLLEVLKDDQTESLREFSTVAAFIGGKNADWASHFRVTVEFLDLLWSNVPALDDRVMRATGIMLSNILRFSGSRWPTIVAGLWVRSENCEWRPYLHAWRIGHFLPDGEVREVLKSFSSS